MTYSKVTEITLVNYKPLTPIIELRLMKKANAQVIQNNNVSHEIEDVKSVWINGVDVFLKYHKKSFLFTLLLIVNIAVASACLVLHYGESPLDHNSITTPSLFLNNNKEHMSKLVTLGVRLNETDYKKIKVLAEDLGMSLSQFGENSIMTCLELIESVPNPKMNKFLKGSRYWVHQAEKEKTGFAK